MLLQQQQQQHRAPLVSLSIPLLLASPPTIGSSFLKSPSSAAALPLSLFLVLAASTAGGLPIQQLLPQLASLRQLHPLFLHTAHTRHAHKVTQGRQLGKESRKACDESKGAFRRVAGGLRRGCVVHRFGTRRNLLSAQRSSHPPAQRKFVFTSFGSSLGWMPPPSPPLPPSLPTTQPTVLSPPKTGKRKSSSASSEASPYPLSSSTA